MVGEGLLLKPKSETHQDNYIPNSQEVLLN
jgi:hypothetical protein